MKAGIFFGYFIMLFIGIVIGGKVVSLVYKPMFTAQAVEIYRMEDKREEAIARCDANIAALTQDLEGHDRYVAQFIEDRAKLDLALKRMGLLDQVKEWEDKITFEAPHEKDEEK